MLGQLFDGYPHRRLGHDKDLCRLALHLQLGAQLVLLGSQCGSLLVRSLLFAPDGIEFILKPAIWPCSSCNRSRWLFVGLDNAGRRQQLALPGPRRCSIRDPGRL